jgi:hypothetical protein
MFYHNGQIAPVGFSDFPQGYFSPVVDPPLDDSVVVGYLMAAINDIRSNLGRFNVTMGKIYLISNVTNTAYDFGPLDDLISYVPTKPDNAGNIKYLQSTLLALIPDNLSHDFSNPLAPPPGEYKVPSTAILQGGGTGTPASAEAGMDPVVMFLLVGVAIYFLVK